MIVHGSTSSVPQDTEVTVLSITNTGNKKFIESIGISGDARSEWFVYLNTNLIAKRRIGSGKPSLTIPLYNLLYNTGGILDVKVKHFEPQVLSFDSEVNISE